MISKKKKNNQEIFFSLFTKIFTYLFAYLVRSELFLMSKLPILDMNC